MSISRKIISIIWTIALLVSLPGCIGFEPAVTPLEISDPNSTPGISSPQIQNPLIPPVPGITPSPLKPSYLIDINLNPYDFHGCPKGSQERISKKCGGDLLLGWEEYDGKFRVFLDGDCRVLDPAKDAAYIELVRDGITNMIDANEQIKQYDKDINSESRANTGGGFATVGGALAVLDCAFGTKVGCGWLIWVGASISLVGGAIVYSATNESIGGKNTSKQEKVDEIVATKVTVNAILASKMQCPKP